MTRIPPVILNERGFRTGDGLPLTSIAVGYVRKAYGLKSRFDRSESSQGAHSKGAGQDYVRLHSWFDEVQ